MLKIASSRRKKISASAILLIMLLLAVISVNKPSGLQTQQGQIIEVRNLPSSSDDVFEEPIPEPYIEVEEKIVPSPTVTPTIVASPGVEPTPTPTPKPSPTFNFTPTPKPTQTQQSKSNCDPNYSGCVPVASDVDCAGGSGNGPAYVRGPIYVIGVDIYDLDRDGDGVGCE